MEEHGGQSGTRADRSTPVRREFIMKDVHSFEQSVMVYYFTSTAYLGVACVACRNLVTGSYCITIAQGASASKRPWESVSGE